MDETTRLCCNGHYAVGISTIAISMCITIRLRDTFRTTGPALVRFRTQEADSCCNRGVRCNPTTRYTSGIPCCRTDCVRAEHAVRIGRTGQPAQFHIAGPIHTVTLIRDLRCTAVPPPLRNSSDSEEAVALTDPDHSRTAPHTSGRSTFTHVPRVRISQTPSSFSSRSEVSMNSSLCCGVPISSGSSSLIPSPPATISEFPPAPVSVSSPS